MFGKFSEMASMLSQARTIGPKIQAAMDQLKFEKVVGESGGGMVKVMADGLGQIKSVEIDPILIERNDWEMVTDLLPAAINQATAAASEKRTQKMSEAAGGLQIPAEMEGMLKNFLN